MHFVGIYLLLLSTSTAQISTSLTLSNLNTSNATPPQVSQLLPLTDISNDSPYHTCRMPSNPLWLNYTLWAPLSRSGISALLFRAQRQVKVLQNLGFGDRRIGPPPGRYRYNGADLMIYARDLEAEKRPNLTWDMMLEAIELVRYCTIEKGVYSEIQALIYAGDVRVGVVDVKLARMPDGAVEDE